MIIKKGVVCLGKGKCENKHCPICKPAYMFKNVQIKQKDFFGSSPPTIFVGSKLMYPRVNVGILSPPAQIPDSWKYDAQQYWAQNQYSIKDIVDLRSQLINSRFQTSVKESSKFLDLSQEIGMAIKPVDVEINLKKEVQLRLDFMNVVLPQGPRAELKKVRITENPKIPLKVDKVVSDSNLKSVEALKYLYKNNFDEQNLSQLLSIGVLGIKKDRRLVPTRWGITATDDTLGKFLIEQIKDYKFVNDYQLFFGNYLGNYYFIMVFPEVFNYELFEIYLPKCAWNPSGGIKVCTDYETFYGRKSYAKETVGGYYASRLPILEYLNSVKRQGTILVVRFETPEYFASLGVFVVRESCRKALQNKLVFENKELMLKYVRDTILKKFFYDVNIIFSKSIVLNVLMNQKKLQNYFHPFNSLIPKNTKTNPKPNSDNNIPP